MDGWLALAVGSYFLYGLLNNIRTLPKGDYTYRIDAIQNAWRFLAAAVVAGALLYFVAEDLVKTMSWFFLTVGIFLAIGAFVLLVQMRKHGQNDTSHIGVRVSVLCTQSLIVSGFVYVFLRMIFWPAA